MKLDLLEMFKKITGVDEKDIGCWYYLGKHSMRFRMNTGEILIFTANNKNNWRLETVTSYMSKPAELYNYN